ncbi:hypothetical protein [Micromonospora sp. 4G55]|uniref:hypothetical protein n=1 Tax=Micromonospora sp. 4G55 TaxID=2806102 RepID=UPI001A50AB21|nr:hypothetical protein [Micromonospora sp. 4G55]MBM0256358.1 hypothetical protein [Micromonospora sp. 4G55]
MTAASVLEGPSGRAVRTDLRKTSAEFRGFIVDEWTIQPDRGGPWQLVMSQDDGDYLLMVARVDPLKALLGLVSRRARERSVEVAVILPVHAESRAHARALTREMARDCVQGGLPLPPQTDNERHRWALTGLLFSVATGAATTHGTAAEKA